MLTLDCFLTGKDIIKEFLREKLYHYLRCIFHPQIFRMLLLRPPHEVMFILGNQYQQNVFEIQNRMNHSCCNPVSTLTESRSSILLWDICLHLHLITMQRVRM